MTWEELAALDGVVGGDLQIEESNMILRGPISKCYIKDNKLIIETEWTARLTKNAKWVKSTLNGEVSININNGKPFNLGSGQISFYLYMIGHAIIHRKGGSKLRLENVYETDADALAAS